MLRVIAQCSLKPVAGTRGTALCAETVQQLKPGEGVLTPRASSVSLETQRSSQLRCKMLDL